jgi:hypothetical protein
MNGDRRRTHKGKPKLVEVEVEAESQPGGFTLVQPVSPHKHSPHK